MRRRRTRRRSEDPRDRTIEEVEGTYASTSMDPDLRVNLGEVPVYGVKKASSRSRTHQR